MGMCCSKFGGSYLIKKEDGNVTKNGAGATPKITKVNTIIGNGNHFFELSLLLTRFGGNWSNEIQQLIFKKYKSIFISSNFI